MEFANGIGRTQSAPALDASACGPPASDQPAATASAAISLGAGMRANIDVLLEQHKDTIAALRTTLGGDLPADRAEYDDIFLLRYVLSHKGDVDKCADCVRKTIQWRIDNADKLKAAIETGFGPWHNIAIKFNAVGYAGKLPEGEEPMYVVRTGFCGACRCWKPPLAQSAPQQLPCRGLQLPFFGSSPKYLYFADQVPKPRLCGASQTFRG